MDLYYKTTYKRYFGMICTMYFPHENILFQVLMAMKLLCNKVSAIHLLLIQVLMTHYHTRDTNLTHENKI